METILIIVAGLSVVLLTSLIKNVQWDHRAKNLVATILSIIAAALLFVTGVDFTAVTSLDLLGLITSVYGTSQLIYNFILTGTGLGQRVENKLAGASHDNPEPPAPDDTFTG